MRWTLPLRQLLGNRSIVLALFGFGAYTLVMHGVWVALMVYAFAQGGVAEAGVVSLVVLVPAALAGPFVAVMLDRLHPSRALAFGLAAQMVAVAAVGGAIWADAASWIVYAAMSVFSVTQMSSRPTIATVLPRISNEPTELAAANSGVGLLETTGLFLGPGWVGLILLASEELALPFLISAVVLAVAALTSLFVTTADGEFGSLEPNRSVLREVREGIVLLREQAAPRQLVLLMSSGRLVAGALQVGIVAVAINHLGRSEATVGLLGSAIGIGGVLGALLTFSLVGRRRLSMPVAIGVAMMSLPLVALATTSSLALSILMLAISGTARPVLEVSGRMLLQGLSTDDTLARIFGILEGLSLLAVALGSLGFSEVASRTSVPTALLITGLVPPAILGVLYAKLLSIDATRPEIDRELLATVRDVSIFAPLSPFGIEQMLTNMHSVEHSADDVVFAEGDDGDLLYVVAEGSAVVELKGGDTELVFGGFFGEIALLRDQPRMATVRAGVQGLRTYTLDREIFLDAVSSSPRSRLRASAVVDQRLGDD